MRLREARPSDAAGIAKVHVDTWRSAYQNILPADLLAGLSYERRERMWNEALVGDRDRVFIYVVVDEDNEEENSEIIGFAASGRVREQTDANVGEYAGELYAIYVLAEYQGKGWGRRLFLASAQRLLDEGLPSMMLWVLADNDTRHFYESLGGVAYAEKTEEFGGASFVEVAYGWANLEEIIPLHWGLK